MTGFDWWVATVEHGKRQLKYTPKKSDNGEFRSSLNVDLTQEIFSCFGTRPRSLLARLGVLTASAEGEQDSDKTAPVVTSMDKMSSGYYDPDDVFGHYSPALQPVRPRLRDGPVPWANQAFSNVDDELDLDSIWYPSFRTSEDRRTTFGKHALQENDEQSTTRLSRRNRRAVHLNLEATGPWLLATESEISELPLSNFSDNGSLDDKIYEDTRLSVIRDTDKRAEDNGRHLNRGSMYWQEAAEHPASRPEPSPLSPSRTVPPIRPQWEPLSPQASLPSPHNEPLSPGMSPPHVNLWSLARSSLGSSLPPLSPDYSPYEKIILRDNLYKWNGLTNDDRAETPSTEYSDTPTPSSTTSEPATPDIGPVTPDFKGQFQIRRWRNIRRRKRFILPISIEGATGSSEVLAFPDTGSNDNIISLDMVHDLGLEMAEISNESPMFSIANGKVVEAVGQVTARFTFTKGSPSDSPILDCLFYVFSKLAVPIIVGVRFLDETETFSRHRDRLVEEIVPSMQALRVSSIGKPKKDMVCQLNNYIGCANADTGSDLDLVSPEFATSRGFQIEPAFETLEFADGSYGITCGVIQTTFAVGNQDEVKGFIRRGEAIERDFYILESLTSDILVGINTLEELNVFRHHSESFIPSIPRLGLSDVNVIRYVGTVERLAKHTWRAFKDRFWKTGKYDISDLEGLRELQQDILLAGQRENARRESQRERIAALAGPTREIAQAEEDKRIQDYEKGREQRLQDGLASPPIGMSLCTMSIKTGMIPCSETYFASGQMGRVAAGGGGGLLLESRLDRAGRMRCNSEEFFSI
ncbi:hypothetical protein DL765_007849 [Monosporascus sp. GIB2]|nr:hypothetical protein DL765_007849 [Monosporascus sp. GIB2]